MMTWIMQNLTNKDDDKEFDNAIRMHLHAVMDSAEFPLHAHERVFSQINGEREKKTLKTQCNRLLKRFKEWFLHEG